MYYQPFCETEIEFMSVQQLKSSILSYISNNIVLVMSETSARRWDMYSFFKDLENNDDQAGYNFIWINDVVANPTQRSIVNSLQKISNKKVDLIIAIGGGSAIDLAKGISVFNNSLKNETYVPKEITKRIIDKDYNKDPVEIIAVPSTAGTGSEVTQWATVWDENNTRKFSIDAPSLKPKKAIIVPELTLTVPPKMTLATGLDALTQAMEAYWSKHTTPIVQELAIRAVQLFVMHLRKSIIYPNDLDNREKLCRASLLSGLAFSQTRTTACHSISYPLTMLYGIQHGFAVSLTLDAVAKINEGSFPNDKELLEFFNEYGGIKKWIDRTSKDVIEMNLSAFGITSKDFPSIVDHAFTVGRMDNNPVHINKGDVMNILKSII